MEGSRPSSLRYSFAVRAAAGGSSPGFARSRLGPVTGKIREKGRREHGGGAIGDRLKRAVPEKARRADRLGRGGQTLDEQRQRMKRARERGFTVHAAAFERDMIGAQIALLERMEAQPHPVGEQARGTVRRAAIAEHHDVGDAPLTNIGREPGGPVLARTTIPARAHARPVEQVAAIEIDAGDVNALCPQMRAQPAEERPR